MLLQDRVNWILTYFTITHFVNYFNAGSKYWKLFVGGLLSYFRTIIFVLYQWFIVIRLDCIILRVAITRLKHWWVATNNFVNVLSLRSAWSRPEKLLHCFTNTYSYFVVLITFHKTQIILLWISTSLAALVLHIYWLL